jgi:hypothetical protein
MEAKQSLLMMEYMKFAIGKVDAKGVVAHLDLTK